MISIFDLKNLLLVCLVGLQYEQRTARKPDGSYVFPGAENLRIFTSDKITCVDLSAVGHFIPEFNDNGASILNLCVSLEVGAVTVLNCPGFGEEDYMYFVQQGGVEIMRMKAFLRHSSFPVIGYYARPHMDAAGTHYSIFMHEIRAVYMQWRMGAEQAERSLHINVRHIYMFLKKFHDEVLVAHGHSKKMEKMIQKYQQLYASCPNKPRSDRRAKSVANFIRYLPSCALMMLSSSEPEFDVLTHRHLDKPWRTAKFSDDVACKLLDGLTRLRMPETYFSTIFKAYQAKASATGEQAVAIAAFERELSGGVGPFSEEGVASGNPCSAFALFSECRANDIVDDSEGDGTFGDQWNGLSQEVKGIYAEVARTIAMGHLLSDLKTQVEAKCTEQAQAHAQEAPPPAAAAAPAGQQAHQEQAQAALEWGVPSGQQPQVQAFFLFSLSCSQ